MVFCGTAQVREVSQIWLTSHRERECKHEPTPWITEVSPFLLLLGLLSTQDFQLGSMLLSTHVRPPRALKSLSALLGKFLLHLPTQSCFFNTYLPSACSASFQPVNGALQATRGSAPLHSPRSSLSPHSSPQLGVGQAAAPRVLVLPQARRERRAWRSGAIPVVHSKEVRCGSSWICLTHFLIKGQPATRKKVYQVRVTWNCPSKPYNKRPGLMRLTVLFCITWITKNLPINRVIWLQVFWAGNRLLWDAQGPSLEHAYRAVHAEQKGPATAASKHYIILTV